MINKIMEIAENSSTRSPVNVDQKYWFEFLVDFFEQNKIVPKNNIWPVNYKEYTKENQNNPCKADAIWIDVWENPKWNLRLYIYKRGTVEDIEFVLYAKNNELYPCFSISPKNFSIFAADDGGC